MASRPRPFLVATLIGLVAEALFLWGVATPHELVFDEIHYVPAARAMLSLSAPLNTEHPLVAKEFIAAGIALFGDNALGWRFFSTVAGAATVMGVFAILWQLFGRTRPAVIGTVLALLNFTIYVQARIAMLDGFLAAFTVLAVAAMLWAMRAPVGKAWSRWGLSAVLFGLAVGTKWLALPYLAFAGLAFLIVRWRDARAAQRPSTAMLSGKDQPHWPGLPTIPALAAFGVIAVATYFLTFLPAFFYHDDPMTLTKLLPFQAKMYAQQTQVLPHHTYQSNWWTWPLMIRPIWYFYEPADGAMRGILMIGNPAILWGGLVAVAACLWTGVGERDGRLLTAGALWVASYLPWVIIPKSLGFFYYYYIPTIALPIALAAAFDRYAKGKLMYWDEGFMVMCFGLAVYFFPILSAAPLANAAAFQHWMWFSTWP
ncbi:MAG: phospholipid carrier-dependent glycosyltransferase [Sphingomonas sp.]|uniref:phospholipid carrier-dependent glycosyltransferase n=1 Tax=Sphingomonas sp. TaxID=28214 RepID=UPI00120A2AEB|nr:phospholipid carrier-dependent glycosyltransferase [Sphingomonas sp.]THD37346.1 MAG: phospholipid carrier-dependent glycosyltransferase [Sphingomonas sp.]